MTEVIASWISLIVLHGIENCLDQLTNGLEGIGPKAVESPRGIETGRDTLVSDASRFVLANGASNGRGHFSRAKRGVEIRGSGIEADPTSHDTPWHERLGYPVHTLSVSPFAPPPDSSSYHALSYTWGDSAAVVSIEVNGKRKGITRNLEAALRQFRSQTKGTTWWIDAICIDQGDNAEKSSQVYLMRYIYMGAKTVHVWLGDGADKSTSAMQLLVACEDTGFPEAIMRGLLSRDKSILQIFLDLFNRPYWKRVWIVQELVCAYDVVVHCGDWWVNWSTLVKVNEMLRRLELNRYPQIDGDIKIDSASSIYSNDVALITEIKEQRDRTIARKAENTIGDLNSLWWLVAAQGNRQATNERDKVYAMVGLADDISHFQVPLVIDYNRSVKEVYVDLVKHVNYISNRLDFLTEIRTFQKTRSKFNLPTWCPDWDLSHKNNLLQDIYRRYSQPVDASDTTFTKAVFRADEDLAVLGVLHDKIRTICDVFDWEHIFWDLWLTLVPAGDIPLLRGQYTERKQISLSRWASLIQLSDPNFTATITDHGESIAASSSQIQRAAWESILEYVPSLAFDGAVSEAIMSLWKTLIASETFDWEDEGGFDARLRCYIGLVEAPSQERLNPKEAFLEYTLPFRRFVSIASGGRRFFVSENGRFGLAPEDAQKGDFVCVLFGCSLPMLLRSQEDKYEVIGPVYLQDTMSGEAVTPVEVGAKQRQEFVLR